MDDYYIVTHTDADGNASDVQTEISTLEDLVCMIGPNESVTITRKVA